MANVAALIDDLGGTPAIKAALDAFYGKVLIDDELSGFFDGVDIPSLKVTQTAFFTNALGGEAEYSGRSLRDAHARLTDMGLDDGLFDRFVGHFEAVLQEFGVPDDKLEQVLVVVQGARNEVLGR